jgi:predicted porin
MKTSILAVIALGGSAACACAQESGSSGSLTVERGEPAEARTRPPAPSHIFPVETNSIALGRQYSLEYLAIAGVGDPGEGGGAGSAANLIGGGGNRPANRVQYYSPPVHGLSAGASFAEERIDRSTAQRAWGLSIGFEAGPFVLRAAHQNRNVAKIRLYDQTGNNLEAKNSLLAANLRFKWGTAYTAYSVNRGWGSSPLFNPDNPYSAGMSSAPSTDSRDVLVGLAVPVGHTTFLASFMKRDDRDRANRDANQFSFGASYSLTRRTDFYAAYSRIQNTGSAGIALTAPGSVTSAVNLGMRHAF